MRVLSSWSQLNRARKGIVLAAGFFDGVHCGHGRVLNAALAQARARRAAAWTLTFDAHPLTVLRPELAPALLTAPAHKLALIRGMGFDGCLVLPFTRALAGMDHETFAEQLLANIPSLRHVCAGPNWRFGKNGVGAPAWLARHARAAGRDVTVSVVRQAMARGQCVSSSRIRASVARGQLDEAAILLGRPFSVWGRVVPGRGVGRRLGAPTANLVPAGLALPPSGVYAARVRIEPGRGRARSSDAVVFLGRPHASRRGSAPAPVLEAHLLDTNGDLYGREIEVVFQRKLRPVRRFAAQDALAAQIRTDIEHARRALARR